MFDFDNHAKGAEQEDHANVNDSWKDEINALRRICKNPGVDDGNATPWDKNAEIDAVGVKGIVNIVLIERLRKAGFEIRLVEDSCEHYTVVDNDINENDNLKGNDVGYCIAALYIYNGCKTNIKSIFRI